MVITKEIEIDMAHRVMNHKSKCRNLHGHRYKIEVGVDDKVITTPGSPEEGMVIDFSDLKEIMMTEIDARFDHNAIFFELDPAKEHLEALHPFQIKEIEFVSFVPTAENLAKFWYEIVEPKLLERGIKLAHIKVWETPTSTATYEA